MTAFNWLARGEIGWTSSWDSGAGVRPIPNGVAADQAPLAGAVKSTYALRSAVAYDALAAF